MKDRRSNYDITNQIDISDPSAVCDAVCEILDRRYPGVDLAPIHQAFETFARLYAGILPGYRGCDTWYHDVQHSLDCTLAMARLLDGHDRSVQAARQLGERRARFGVMCALFHDAGYLRRWSESHFHNGAEFTLYHVSRSGDFLAEFLPSVGFGAEAELARRIVHYTGYEMALDKIRVRSEKDHRVGYLLGTADLLSQMADRCYPEKCLRFLYHEFEACGLAGEPIRGVRKPVYASPGDLLLKTPGFVQTLFAERLDGYFNSAHSYMKAHFGGDENPYIAQIVQHLEFIERVIIAGDASLMRRQPRSLNGRAFRKSVGIRLASAHPQHEPLIRTRHHSHARHQPGARRAAQHVPA